MLHLGDVEFGVFLLKDVGIDEGGLVSQVFWALAEMFWEKGFCFPF